MSNSFGVMIIHIKIKNINKLKFVISEVKIDNVW